MPAAHLLGHHAITPDGAKMPMDFRAVTVYSLTPATDPPRLVKREHHDTDGNMSKPVRVYISHFLSFPSVALHSRSGLRAEAEA